jgi:hypothetical protein
MDIGTDSAFSSVCARITSRTFKCVKGVRDRIRIKLGLLRVYIWITQGSRKTTKTNEENDFKSKRELERTQAWRALHAN